MKTVLLTTNHPAPYIDQWLKRIEKEYNLIVIYNKKKDDQKTWKDYKGHFGYYYEELKIRDLKKLVQKADLLIVGGWTNKECFATIVMGKIYGKKLAIFTDFPFHQNKYADIFKKIFLYRWVNYIFGATESTCEFIENKYALPKNKVKLFPYAVNLPSVVPSKEKIDIEHIRVFVANNFVERKGYYVLFEALKKLQNASNAERFIFDIAGHGELYDKYVEEAKQIDLAINFHGWSELAEYTRLINNCDVYIHASIEEPFGIPPLDAMACEKVVIVSDGVKSTNRLIRNKINGYTYPAHDWDELYRILKDLDSSDFERMGKQARKDVVSKYNLSINMQSIEESLNGRSER